MGTSEERFLNSANTAARSAGCVRTRANDPMLALMTFTMMVSAPIMGVGGIVLALNLDVPLSGVLLLIVPVLGVIMALIIQRMRPHVTGTINALVKPSELMGAQRPLSQVIRPRALTTLSVQEALVVYFKVSLVSGLVIASPGSGLQHLAR